MTKQKLYFKDIKSMYLIESNVRLVKDQISQETVLEIGILIGFFMERDNDEQNNQRVLKRDEEKGETRLNT